MDYLFRVDFPFTTDTHTKFLHIYDVNTHHLHILFKVSPAMGKLEKERKEQTMQSQESVFDFSFSLKDY